MPAKKTTTKRSARSPKGLRHHARRIYHGTPRFVHGIVIGAFVGMVLVMSFGPILPVGALTLSSPRDCDSNAVISCGALTTKELQSGYTKKGVKTIYSHFGISAQDIKDIDKYVAAGRVYDNGDVKIGDTLVATGAITVGRENIKGSTKVTKDGVTFYTRPPGVSFRVKSIAAFVVLKDGRFAYAILAACGNPVTATPKTPEVVPPKEEEPEINTTVQLRTSTQTPDSKPTPVVVANASLPDTGPGDVLVVLSLAVIGGYLYHITHRHIRRRHAQHG